MSNDVRTFPRSAKTGLVMPMMLVENFALQDYYKRLRKVLDELDRG